MVVLYKDLGSHLINKHRPAPDFPSALSPFFFFFFLFQNRPRFCIYSYLPTYTRPPSAASPKMRVTLLILATLFHLALCRGSGSGGSDPGKDPGRDPGGEDPGGDKPEPLPPTVCCTKAPQCGWDPAVSCFFLRKKSKLCFHDEDMYHFGKKHPD